MHCFRGISSIPGHYLLDSIIPPHLSPDVKNISKNYQISPCRAKLCLLESHWCGLSFSMFSTQFSNSLFQPSLEHKIKPIWPTKLGYLRQVQSLVGQQCNLAIIWLNLRASYLEMTTAPTYHFLRIKKGGLVLGAPAFLWCLMLTTGDVVLPLGLPEPPKCTKEGSYSLPYLQSMDRWCAEDQIWPGSSSKPISLHSAWPQAGKWKSLGCLSKHGPRYCIWITWSACQHAGSWTPPWIFWISIFGG